MENYLGIKLLKAEPMNRFAFLNKVKNEDIPQNEEDQPGYHVLYPDGYHSWSPENVFNEAYRKILDKEYDLLSGN